ncbi:hydantoinase B/oxoprolinase family protein, partial [Nonomuraea sp. NPDC049784]|uniref:hydantoinase B/oxoprolinase family protein n=1 Tax=Nonomuraea sp. NPDC049784 TaxID=3154361 RepID=UPI003406CAE9
GARGLFGGGDGATGGLEVTRSDGTVQRLSHIDAVTLAAGERVSLRTGGGGGYGPPVERPAARREADLRDGLTLNERVKETPQ